MSYEQKEREVKQWIEGLLKKSLSGSLEEELKNGVVICNVVNAIRPNTILTINNYNAAFRQMQNIDNFLKVIEKLGVPDSDRFKTEDLFYGNNFPKVIVALVSLSNVCHEKFGTPSISKDGLEDVRHHAAGSQKEGKVREVDTGLSIFENNQKKAQKDASLANRSKDRMIHENQKAVPTSELGFVESEMSGKQKMISSAKSSGQDLIIRSKDVAVASSELGFIESEMSGKQRMISDAKHSGQDLIIRSKDVAVASSELGFIDSNLSDRQTMISDAKSRQMDNIIRTKDKSVASGELGFIDSDLVHKQEMISDAKGEKLDKIIKHSKDNHGDVDVNLDD